MGVGWQLGEQTLGCFPAGAAPVVIYFSEILGGEKNEHGASRGLSKQKRGVSVLTDSVSWLRGFPEATGLSAGLREPWGQHGGPSRGKPEGALGSEKLCHHPPPAVQVAQGGEATQPNQNGTRPHGPGPRTGRRSLEGRYYRVGWGWGWGSWGCSATTYPRPGRPCCQEHRGHSPADPEALVSRTLTEQSSRPGQALNLSGSMFL